MTLDQRKEQLSVAYAYAVASAAGCSVKDVKVDDDSVDMTIVSTLVGSALHAPELNIQLKATSRNIRRQHEVSFPLELKNYEDLRKKTLVPRILVVMLLPRGPANWLKQAESHAEVSHCAYWKSLYGMPATRNSSTVTVKLLRSDILTPAALSSIMSTIANGGRP